MCQQEGQKGKYTVAYLDLTKGKKSGRHHARRPRYLSITEERYEIW